MTEKKLQEGVELLKEIKDTQRYLNIVQTVNPEKGDFIKFDSHNNVIYLDEPLCREVLKLIEKHYTRRVTYLKTKLAEL